jgi:hypothetical protein
MDYLRLVITEADCANEGGLAHDDPVVRSSEGDQRAMSIGMEETIGLMKRLSAERFYGSIELKMENGRVVILKKTETIKPTDGRSTRGYDNGNSK